MIQRLSERPNSPNPLVGKGVVGTSGLVKVDVKGVVANLSITTMLIVGRVEAETLNCGGNESLVRLNLLESS